MQKMTAYEKVMSQCTKNNWKNPPPYDPTFNYEILYKMLDYSKVKIEIGKTHNPSSWDNFLNLLIEYKKFKNAVTLECMVFIYGEELGTQKFENYKKVQAETNTFEYKKRKYGFTKEQFEEYNKSRAVTLKNLIKKHGEEEGRLRYEKYCKVQAYTNTEEYLGTERYKKVNRLKSHRLEVYIEKYGEELGPLKLLDFFQKCSKRNSYSRISQELFQEVELFLTEKDKKHTYYATKNKEYAILHESRCFLYDFVCTNLKFCIEYHGDHYHGNPLMYKPDDRLKGWGVSNVIAKEKWELDERKISALKKERDYDTIIIWDIEWTKDPENVKEKIKNFIDKRRLELNGGIY